MFDKLKGHRTKFIAVGIVAQVIVRAIDGSISIGEAVAEVLAAFGLLTARAPGADAVASLKKLDIGADDLKAIAFVLLLPTAFVLSGCVPAEARATSATLQRQITVHAFACACSPTAAYLEKSAAQGYSEADARSLLEKHESEIESTTSALVEALK